MPLLASTAGPLAHTLLEAGAYFVGARIYWKRAAALPRPASTADRLLLLASALFGAMAGSKLLHVAEHLPTLLERDQWALWLGGKSLLGALLGATLAVELAKRAIGWRAPTGDAWVPALAAGIAVGRLGCQLSGPWDQTYGVPTTLPWGWDYGDGVPRHPVALYESLVVLLLAALASTARFAARPGAGFAAFALGYCVFRAAVELLKPPFGASIADTLPVATWGGATAIQWAALAGAAWYLLLLQHRLAGTGTPAAAAAAGAPGRKP